MQFVFYIPRSITFFFCVFFLPRLFCCVFVVVASDTLEHFFAPNSSLTRLVPLRHFVVFEVRLLFPGRPHAFFFEMLEQHRYYTVSLDGVDNADARTGAFTTLKVRRQPPRGGVTLAICCAIVK